MPTSATAAETSTEVSTDPTAVPIAAPTAAEPSSSSDDHDGSSAPLVLLPAGTRLGLPEAIVSTEGIAVDQETERLFVGDLSNGNVWVGGLDGEPFKLFADAGDSRSQALGLAVDSFADRLVVATGLQGTVWRVPLIVRAADRGRAGDQ